ncbi:hypothetical protein BTR25_24220 [Bacillus sp. MRMR6]|nr:hypothetical protein BTR25_24220 [Bacillus sp. MRMR6]
MPAGTRELKEMPFYLIEGILQWERDFTVLPDQLYKGHLLFMKHRAMLEPDVICWITLAVSLCKLI